MNGRYQQKTDSTPTANAIGHAAVRGLPLTHTFPRTACVLFFYADCWLVSSVVVTLLGAAAAYFINANILLSATHIYLNPGWSEETAMYVNTLFYMILMYPLTCIK